MRCRKRWSLASHFRSCTYLKSQQLVKSTTTFYTQVTDKELLVHLKANCTNFPTIDVVKLPAHMKGYYADAEGIPQ